MPLKYKASCHYCKTPLFPGADVRYIKNGGWMFWCNEYCEKGIIRTNLNSTISSYSSPKTPDKFPPSILTIFDDTNVYNSLKSSGNNDNTYLSLTPIDQRQLSQDKNDNTNSLGPFVKTFELKYETKCNFCKKHIEPGYTVKYIVNKETGKWTFWCDNTYCIKQKKKTTMLDDSILSSYSYNSPSSSSSGNLVVIQPPHYVKNLNNTLSYDTEGDKEVNDHNYDHLVIVHDRSDDEYDREDEGGDYESEEEGDEGDEDDEYNDDDRAALDQALSEDSSDAASSEDEVVVVEEEGPEDVSSEYIPYNYIYCHRCDTSKHPDSFSAQQKKFLRDDPDNYEIYCLAHTGTSGFNRSYRKPRKPTAEYILESESEESDYNEAVLPTRRSSSKRTRGYHTPTKPKKRHNSDRTSPVTSSSSHTRARQPSSSSSSSSSAVVAKATREVISIGDSSGAEGGVADDVGVDSSLPTPTRTLRRRRISSQDSRAEDMLTPVKASATSYSSSSSSDKKVHYTSTTHSSCSSSSNNNKHLNRGTTSSGSNSSSGRMKSAGSIAKRMTSIDIDEGLYNTDDEVELDRSADQEANEVEEESDDDDDDDVIFSPCGKRIKLS